MKISITSLNAGFTLAEVVIAIALSAMSMAGLISGYVLSAQRTEWSVCSEAAQAQANERIEQTRAARWDPTGAIDELVSTNFPVLVLPLNLPRKTGQYTYCTNTTTITLISTNPPFRMIKTESVWRILNKGLNTNTAVTYRSPDQ